MSDEPAQYLSQYDFSEHSDEISVQVRAILASKGETRRRFCALEIRERHSGDLVGEVLRTTYGLVSVHQTQVRRLPSGQWTTYRLQSARLMAAVTGDEDQPFRFASRSAQYLVRGAELLRQIERGAPSLLLDQRFASRRADRPAPIDP